MPSTFFVSLLGLVHTSDGIGSGVGIGSARSITIKCKSKKRNRKQSRKHDRIRVRRIRRVSFSSDSASAYVASVLPIHTRSELSSNSDSAYDSASVASVASVNQPLQKTNRIHVAVHLLTVITEDVIMWYKHQWHTRLLPHVSCFCSYHILTSSVIIAEQMHWNIKSTC